MAWLVLWVLGARVVHGVVLLLAAPGQAVAHLGRSMSGTMTSAASAARDVPRVGDQLTDPSDALASAGRSVGGAAQSAQDAVGTPAAVLAVLPVVLPSAGRCCVGCRGTWAGSAARTARRLLNAPPDLELLTARALAGTRGWPDCRPAPGPRVVLRDPGTVCRLAVLELDRLGLRLPDHTGAGS